MTCAYLHRINGRFNFFGPGPGHRGHPARGNGGHQGHGMAEIAAPLAKKKHPADEDEINMYKHKKIT